MNGPKLLASYVSPTYGAVRDAFWPHGCGTHGSVRWEVAPAGKLAFACDWHGGPSSAFLRFRWNADEGELQLDDAGVTPGR
jgi:hypothetical protein